MKQLCTLFVLLSMVLVLFCGCGTTDPGSSMPNGNEVPESGQTQTEDKPGHNATDDNPTQVPDETNPSAKDETPEAENDIVTLPDGDRADTVRGQMIRGTGTAKMVTGDTPATDHNNAPPAPPMRPMPKKA